MMDKFAAREPLIRHLALQECQEEAVRHERACVEAFIAGHSQLYEYRTYMQVCAIVCLLQCDVFALGLTYCHCIMCVQAHLSALFHAADAVYSGYVTVSKSSNKATALQISCQAVGAALKNVPFVGIAATALQQAIRYVC